MARLVLRQLIIIISKNLLNAAGQNIKEAPCGKYCWIFTGIALQALYISKFSLMLGW